MVSSVWGGLWGVVLAESEVLKIWSNCCRLVQMAMVGVVGHGVVLCVLLFVILIRMPRFCGEMDVISGRKWNASGCGGGKMGRFLQVFFLPRNALSCATYKRNNFFLHEITSVETFWGLGKIMWRLCNSRAQKDSKDEASYSLV